MNVMLVFPMMEYPSPGTLYITSPGGSEKTITVFEPWEMASSMVPWIDELVRLPISL